MQNARGTGRRRLISGWRGGRIPVYGNRFWYMVTPHHHPFLAIICHPSEKRLGSTDRHSHFSTKLELPSRRGDVCHLPNKAVYVKPGLRTSGGLSLPPQLAYGDEADEYVQVPVL